MAYEQYAGGKSRFLALRYDPDAAIRCTEEFKPRWPEHVLIIEEEYKEDFHAQMASR